MDTFSLTASMQQGDWKSAQQLLEAQQAPATTTVPAWQLLKAEFAAGKLASRGRAVSQDPEALQAAQRAQQAVHASLAAQALPDACPCLPADLARLSRVQAMLKVGRPAAPPAHQSGGSSLFQLTERLSGMLPDGSPAAQPLLCDHAASARLDVSARSMRQVPSAACCRTVLASIAEQGPHNPSFAGHLHQTLSRAVLPAPAAHKAAKPGPVPQHLEPYALLLKLSQLGLALQSGRQQGQAAKQLSMHICRQLGQLSQGPGKTEPAQRREASDAAQAALSGACLTLAAWASKHPEVAPSQQHLPSFAGKPGQEEAARHAATIPAAQSKPLHAQVCCQRLCIDHVLYLVVGSLQS